MNFEDALIAKAAQLSGLPIGQFSWGQAPIGAPQPGAPQIVLRHAPGGERELTMSGVSSVMGRVIQVSVFGQTVQEVRRAGEALHLVEGFQGSLADNSYLWCIAPALQDIDGVDNDENLFQLVITWNIQMNTNGPSFEGSVFDAQLGALEADILDGGTV